MPKSDTISAIMRLNPTAQPQFLADFPSDDLDQYLDRLQEIAGGRRTDEPDAPDDHDPFLRSLPHGE